MSGTNTTWRKTALSAVVACVLVTVAFTAYFRSNKPHAPPDEQPAASLKSLPVDAHDKSGTVHSLTQTQETKQFLNPESLNNEASRRARFFPKLEIDTPASVLLSSLNQTPVTAEHSAEFNKFAKTINRCWFARQYERMANRVSPSLDPKRHGAAQKIAKEERQRNETLCADLPDEAFDKSDQWITELAHQGDEQSMFTYTTELFWTRDGVRVLRDPQKLIEYRANTLSYLDHLIDAGYSQALVMLGSIKLNPLWGEPQQGSAWAYMYAAARAKGDTVLETNLMMSLDRRVPATERTSAIEQAQTLMEKCCGR